MKLRVDQNQTSTGPKRIKTVNEGNTGVLQEGKVATLTKVSRNETGIIKCAAYSGLGNPDSQAGYVNFARVYDICTEKTFTIVLNRLMRFPFIIFFFICAIIYWY